MPDKERQIYLLESDDGKSPFERWYEGLKDSKGRRSVWVYLTRLQDPTFTNFKSVGESVYELRLFVGPGYRVYFALEGNEIVVLLLGGDKSSQVKDIAKAITLWKEYRNETQKHRRKLAF